MQLPVAIRPARVRDAAAKPLNGFLVTSLFILSVYLSLCAYSSSLLPIRLVKGVSMEPNLSKGDLVFVKKISFDDVRIGDVVAFSTAKPLNVGATPDNTLHRVVGVEIKDSKSYLITKGDNPKLSVDAFPVPSESLKGKMFFSLPYVGIPFAYLTDAKGLLFLSIAALLLLLYVPAMAIFYMTVVKPARIGMENADANQRQGKATENPRSKVVRNGAFTRVPRLRIKGRKKNMAKVYQIRPEHAERED